MKKIGIIGGVAWPSTIEYYRIICEESLRYHADKIFSGPVPMPEIHIESLDMNFTMNNKGSDEPGSWVLWDAYFNAAIHRLEQNGAEIISIASVTPHTRLKEISAGIKIPILSVYEAIGLYCNGAGISKLLVLGTMPTMISPAFITGLARYGVTVTHPPDDILKNRVVDIINKLYQNQTNGTAFHIDQIIRESLNDNLGKDFAVCLGCTELPLAFQDFTAKTDFETMGIRYINSSVIHAKSIFKSCIE